MFYTVIDCETTFTIQDKRTNPSPYLSTNKLVSVGTLSFNEVGIIDKQYLIFNHTGLKEDCQAENAKILQGILDKTDVLIAHNMKFDASWLFETGFKYEKALFDTMICAYVFAKGLKTPLSLDECCKRYGLDPKTDVLSEYRKRGFNTDEVPLQELIEYGQNDIEITYQLYNKQKELIFTDSDCKYMEATIHRMNNTLPVLISMERSGIYIDLNELDRVEKDYRAEYDKLKADLQKIVTEKMGHTIINLESPEHLSWVLYSRKVKDKKEWAEIFNIGSEIRNSVSKIKYAKWMGNSQFITAVRANTTKLKKTEAIQCSCCLGVGKMSKLKKDGSPFKKPTLCKECLGIGFIYNELPHYAGFKLLPLSSKYASSGGFSTDKGTIEELLKQDLKDDCREFLIKLLRLNAISTYLSAFVEGFRRNAQDSFVHCNFNMCITATGRLSCTQPNLQNLPRAKTFPIRKTIVSRFKGGKILSVDFEKFEFTIAAILSGDTQAKADILNGIDVHIFTRDTLNAAGLNIDRQEAKSRTFAPLYGATGTTEQEKVYYSAFLEKYKGIKAWHERLEDEALATKQIKSPSGRIYAYPNVRRLPNGRVLGHTQLKNYLVQGMATGDITPIALIEIYKRMKNLKSKLILTVHDSIDADCHPDEVEQIIGIFRYVFDNMNKYVKEYFNLDTDIPIKGELKIGDNWMELQAA